MTELKANIELIAAEEGKTHLEVISMMQTAAASIGNDAALEMLCEVKWEYIG